MKDLDAVRRRLEAKKDFITCQECDEKVPFVDIIKQRLKSDPVACKILEMDETVTRELDTRAVEQILIGHMMAIAGEANQIFRPVTMFDHGIDGEVEFKDNDGKASGKRIYIQLKSGNSYLRTRKGDGSEHQRCANKPAQGSALGGAFKNGKALKGRHRLSRPFRALFMMGGIPRALPWAGLLSGLWP